MNYYEDQIKYLKQTDKPVVIFGTMAMGEIMCITLEDLGIQAVCFCDNALSRLNKKTLNKLPIYTPETAFEMFPTAIVIVGSFNEKNIEKIMIQLRDIGYLDRLHPNALYTYYQINILQRKVNPPIFEKALNHISCPDNSLILNTVSVSLTEKCTLNCKNCAAFVPFFDRPIHYEKETIIKSMENLSKSVDAIEVLTLFGGEPLLHKDIMEIAEHASKLSNVKRINLITNGTIKPSESLMKALSDKVTTIYMSNYGHLSIYKAEITEMCHNHHIIFETEEDDSLWSDVGDLENKHNNQSVLAQNFKSCWRAKNNHMLLDGKFYRCSFSAFTAKLNIIDDVEKDFIDMMHCEFDPQDSHSQLKVLLGDRKPLFACEYCQLTDNIPAKAAVQIKR